MNRKKEFGDWQTPAGLAARVAKLVSKIYGTPQFVIEPTCGIGTFLSASISEWGDAAAYRGYELNAEYVEETRRKIGSSRVEILRRDFFQEDWAKNLNALGRKRLLVIGNPPWVTNSSLGQLGSENLPTKTNFQGLRGHEARTGKANFDIAEWMLLQLIEAIPAEGAVAMLCKTMTARKVLKHLWRTDCARENAILFRIDAKAEFGVAVDACLFFITGERGAERTALIHSDLDLEAPSERFGYVDGDLVSDIYAYERNRNLSGGNASHIWRSGIKHDAAKVMEFNREGDYLINGLGQMVDIEEDYVYPLLKSSDLGNGRSEIRKAVLVPQRHTGEDTFTIKHKAPKTWAYLMEHGSILDERKSSIYANRPRFSIFGVGPYSFSPWKVAVSGLYKEILFVTISPHHGRPVMIDDTCYSISCSSLEEADFLVGLLKSKPAQEFLRSLIFEDSKRPITIDVLKRVSLFSLAQELNQIAAYKQFVRSGPDYEGQLPLLIDADHTHELDRHRILQRKALFDSLR